MNCEPGDIAVVVGSSIYAGRLVEVIRLAPSEDFMLPNGVMNERSGSGIWWVLKSLGTPFPAAKGDGMYGSGPDDKLRPLRGDITEQESEIEAIYE